MNILFLNKFNEHWKENYEKLVKEFPEVDFTATFDPEERLGAIQKADAIVTGRLSAEEISQSKNLKVIFVPFTGLNTFPIDVIKQRRIIISNTHANSRYVAERAVALALTLLGRVTEFHNDLKTGKWNRSIEGEDMWDSFQGKRIGIVGYGYIGKFIAKFAKGFDCKVTGFRREVKNEKDEYADTITNNLVYLVENSDIVFVCLPQTPETKHLINTEILAKMKGKYVINVGRGETIDEEAMYNSLKNGILKGAALDVWYKYPGKNPEPVMPANFPFWELPNVVLSPHKSSHTEEAVSAMIDDTCENIRSFIKNGIPKQTAKL